MAAAFRLCLGGVFLSVEEFLHFLHSLLLVEAKVRVRSTQGKLVPSRLHFTLFDAESVLQAILVFWFRIH